MAVVFSHRVNSTATTIGPIDTLSCFDINHTESIKSPIDSCFDKINNLNLILVKFSSISGLSLDVASMQYNLILLGYISAVESYIREVIRRLIILDKACRISSEEQQLNYGAAINYPIEMLPDALLERSSYASKKNIIDSFKTFLGIQGHTPQELLATLDEFEKICHLRHCVVHRFGKLGSSNAIRFGLEKHSKCLEKPIKLDTNKLFNIHQICENCVLVINDFLFKKIIQRTIEPEYSTWEWDLRKDKKRFLQYYSLFESSIKPNAISNLSLAYNDLRNYKINK